MKVYHTLEPIFDKNSRVLILGSMPSIISRKENMYYANKTNRFWAVMSKIYNEEIIDYKEFILRHHLALWDVIESCDIDSSSDSSIKNVKVNDIKWLIDNSRVDKIFVLGKKAYDLYNKYLLPNIKIEAIYLPSTSSANATYSLDKLCDLYKQIAK